MQSQLPILIFAQSARFIAESAAHAGYTVWAADCFGDVDTQRVAARYQQLPALSALNDADLLTILQKLSKGENCYLVCGTGIEQCYSLLKNLPANILLLGNDFNALQQLRQPELFFLLLQQLALPHPALFDQPNENSLTKNLRSSGGMGINRASFANGDFYQQQITGLSASVCFIANGHDARLLSINEQHCEEGSFRLQHIVSPLTLAEKQRHQLQVIIALLTQHAGLRGVNSLDFMIDQDDHIQILEVNPRISASAELIADYLPLFEWHVSACMGKLPSFISSSRHMRQLSYVFSPMKIKTPQDVVWPATCHDLPAAGTLIAAGEPICTIVVQAEDRHGCQQRYEESLQQLQKILIHAA